THMFRTWLRQLFLGKNWQRYAAASQRRPRRARLTLEALEDRATPATHVWSGAVSTLMTLDGNWSSGGHPVNGESGAIVLVFPNTATQFQVTDNLDGLNVDQIQFTGAASNYVISGATGGVTLNLTGAAASQPNIDDQVGSNTFSATNLTLALTATNEINVAAGTLTINGPLTGASGLTKIGTGTLTLSADSSASYTGPTAVSAGTLLVDGKLGSGAVTVDAGAPLGGKGTVGPVTVTGGTLSPGDSPGKLSTGGNVPLNANATFRAEINGTTAG